MSKKGKPHAQEPADTQPGEILDLTATGGAPSAPEADLAGEDRGAAEAEGTEHPDGAPPADAADQPGVTGDEAAIDAGDGSAGIPAIDPAVVPELVSEPATADGISEPVADAGQPADGEGGAPPVVDAEAEAGERLAAAKAEYGDANIFTACSAAFLMLDHIGEHQEIPDDIYERCNVLALGHGPEAANELAALARRIGRERATPAVAAQQLTISRYFEHADIDPVEVLVIGTFLRTLFDLDEYDQAEEGLAQLQMARPIERQPMPIEDTVMEPVSDTMEGW